MLYEVITFYEIPVDHFTPKRIVHACYRRDQSKTWFKTGRGQNLWKDMHSYAVRSLWPVDFILYHQCEYSECPDCNRNLDSACNLGIVHSGICKDEKDMEILAKFFHRASFNISCWQQNS